jgi:hypothetical protein
MAIAVSAFYKLSQWSISNPSNRIRPQYAILNQVTAGTIALVDMNADKLDGEAKDLAQGSAFHQRIRIEADTDSRSHCEI